LNRLLSILLLAPLLLTGCGYNSGGAKVESGYHWSSLYRPGVRTVAVPIFTTSDFARGVEFGLTKAVINQMEANTPYKVVPREKADTILEGEIVRVNVNTVSQDFTTAIPQEQIVNIIVNFVWKDLRSGKILCERRSFQAASTYYPTLGEDRWVGRQVATERLALSLVQELQADW
jgi:hypothetical protein